MNGPLLFIFIAFSYFNPPTQGIGQNKILDGVQSITALPFTTISTCPTPSNKMCTCTCPYLTTESKATGGKKSSQTALKKLDALNEYDVYETLKKFKRNIWPKNMFGSACNKAATKRTAEENSETLEKTVIPLKNPTKTIYILKKNDKNLHSTISESFTKFDLILFKALTSDMFKSTSKISTSYIEEKKNVSTNMETTLSTTLKEISTTKYIDERKDITEKSSTIVKLKTPINEDSKYNETTLKVTIMEVNSTFSEKVDTTKETFSTSKNIDMKNIFTVSTMIKETELLKDLETISRYSTRPKSKTTEVSTTYTSRRSFQDEVPTTSYSISAVNLEESITDETLGRVKQISQNIQNYIKLLFKKKLMNSENNFTTEESTISLPTLINFHNGSDIFGVRQPLIKSNISSINLIPWIGNTSPKNIPKNNSMTNHPKYSDILPMKNDSKSSPKQIEVVFGLEIENKPKIDRDFLQPNSEITLESSTVMNQLVVAVLLINIVLALLLFLGFALILMLSFFVFISTSQILIPNRKK